MKELELADQITGPLFHVALESDWLAGRVPGGYASSTRGKALAEVGYVHAAYEHQVDDVIARHYADVDEPLVLLVIDPSRLQVEVEEGPALTGELFPRIYGPINRDAVTEVRTLRATKPRDDLQASQDPTKGESTEVGGLIARDLLREGLVYVVVIAAVVLGGFLGTAVDDGAGTLVGIFAGLLVGAALALFVGARMKGARP